MLFASSSPVPCRFRTPATSLPTLMLVLIFNSVPHSRIKLDSCHYSKFNLDIKASRTRARAWEFIDMYHLLISLFVACTHLGIYLLVCPLVAQLISVIN